MLVLPCINGLFESVFNISIFVSSSSISHFFLRFSLLIPLSNPLCFCKSFLSQKLPETSEDGGQQEGEGPEWVVCRRLCVFVWASEWVCWCLWLCVCSQYVCLISSVYLCSLCKCKYANMPLLDNNSWCQMNYFQGLQMLQASGKKDENKTIWCSCLKYS